MKTKKRPVRLTQAQLRALVFEQITEATMAQAKVGGPAKEFWMHLQSAKKALGRLCQDVPQGSMGNCEKLLSMIRQIELAMNAMPDLTGALPSTMYLRTEIT